jgi:glycosyltransferase involved in cell wall biosynthesis
MSQPRIQERGGSGAEAVCEAPPVCHIIIGNGTSKAGGMCAHMALLADGLAEAGQEVHVWQPEETELGAGSAVKIHKTLGTLLPGDFGRTGRALRDFPGPRRLLVYWVPHAYGFKSLNVPFCIWIWIRSAWHKDRVELMVQECFFQFHEGDWRQDAAAVVHRVMTVFLLRAARHVWMALTGYESMLRPFALGRKLDFEWLPVPSNVAVVDDPARVAKIRAELAPSGFLIGHFGTFGSLITELLERLIPALLQGLDASVVLLGTAGQGFRDKLLSQHPDLKGRIHATGFLTDAALSAYLSACDVLIQPYPDGITARRGSTLAPLAHGRPIVTNASAPTEPLWKATGAVVLAELTPQAFLEAVRGLRDDPAERARVGAAAGETYRRYFEPSHMIDTIATADRAKAT